MGLYGEDLAYCCARGKKDMQGWPVDTTGENTVFVRSAAVELAGTDYDARSVLSS